MRRLKRYTISQAYRINTAVGGGGGQPRVVPEADFDIILAQGSNYYRGKGPAALMVADGEVISLVTEILDELGIPQGGQEKSVGGGRGGGEAQKKARGKHAAATAATHTIPTYTIHLGHTLLLQLILEACGIKVWVRGTTLGAASLRTALGKLGSLSKEAAYAEFSMYNLSRSQVDRLISFHRTMDLSSVRDFLHSRVGDAAWKVKAGEALVELERLVRILDILGVPSSCVLISPLMAYNVHYYSGVYFQVVISKINGADGSKGKGKGGKAGKGSARGIGAEGYEILGAGGR